MKDVFESSTFLEVRERPMPRGPRPGMPLLLLALVLLSLGYLFTLVPAILSPTLDLLALAVLGGVSVRGMVAVVRSVRR